MAGTGTQIVELSVQELENRLSITEANLQERIEELEYELEERGWDRLIGQTAVEFSRDALRKIARESMLFYMKNPLIRRAVDLSESYIFGQGITIKADSPIVDLAVQDFLADEKNRTELATPLSMAARDVDLRVNGNLFFVFFTNDQGLVRVRSIPFDEMQDVVPNPDDAREPWYYVRQRQIVSYLGATPQTAFEPVLHPDWQYTPRAKPDTDSHGRKILWDQPVYHVKVNTVGNQRFGLSELYSAQDWARTYNEFLANWATITRALARFAWKVVTKGGSTQRAAVKSKLDSGIANDQYSPAPSTGSVFIETADSATLQPVKTAGATTSPQDGRRLLLMVCAATGFPETFFGDSTAGSLATAKSLDRPTELAFLIRQRLWTQIMEDVIGYAVEARARAGTLDGLSGQDVEDSWDELQFQYAPAPPDEVTGESSTEPMDVHVAITWPDIVERDVLNAVQAIVTAATMGAAGTFAGTLDAKYTTQRLLVALGEKSVEEVMDQFFPEDEATPQNEQLPAVESLRREMKNFLTLLKEARVAE